MRTVHKYALRDVENHVTTFEGVRFLHVANQREEIALWAEVDTEAPEVVRTVYVVGTGHEVPAGVEYVGSALMSGGAFVFHVYAKSDA